MASPERAGLVDITAITQRVLAEPVKDDFAPSSRARQSDSNGVPDSAQVELEKQLAEATEAKQGDIAQLQLNLLREQINTVSREFCAMRQDINTLRLADSQYEVQNAETARHVREMHTQILADVQEGSARSEELTKRIETNVSSAILESQRAVQGVGEVRERMASEISKVTDRMNNLVGACEERFAPLRTLQSAQDEEKVRLDKASAFQSDLAAEVRLIKSDFDGQVHNLQSFVRQSVSHLGDELNSELQTMKEKDVALGASVQFLEERMKSSLASVQEPLKDQIEQLSREISSRNNELKELIARSSAQERVAREEIVANQQVEMQDLQGRCRSDFADKLADYKAGAERIHSNFQELISQEKTAREKAMGGVIERLGDIDRRMRDSAVELTDFRSKVATGTNLESLDRKLNNELQRVSDELNLKHDQLKGSLGNTVATLETLDRKVDRRAKGPAVGEAPAATGPPEGLISGLERKFRDELAHANTEHRARFQELKDAIARSTSDLSSKHAEVNELIGRISVQEKAARDDHKGQTGQTLDALKQELRREIQVVTASFDSATQNLAQEVKNRERAQTTMYEKVDEVDRRSRDSSASEFRKLREDLIAEHSGRQAEVKDTLMRISLDVNGRLTEQKDQSTKLLLQEKSAREELRSGLVLGTDALGTKIRREIEESKAAAERNTGAIRDLLNKERSDREGSFNTIAGSVSAAERRCREEMYARIDEQRSVFFELKDDVAKTLAAELNSRDELRMGVASSIEAFEVKMRREMADDSVIREYVGQERQLREKGLNAASERLSDVERKLMADLAQVSIKREVAITELKDLISDICSRDRGRLQELLIKETEGRAQLQDAVGKQLSQERAAREVQQETLRVYLAQDRGNRDAPMQDLRQRMENIERTRAPQSNANAGAAVSRMEFDSSLRRVWEVVDSHSYNLAHSSQVDPRTVQAFQQSSVQVPTMATGMKAMLYMPPSMQMGAKVAERVVDIPAASPIQKVQAAGQMMRPNGGLSSWVPSSMQSHSQPQSLISEPGGVVIETTRPMREDASGVVTTMPRLSQKMASSERTSSPSPPTVMFAENAEMLERPSLRAEEVVGVASTSPFRALSPMRDR